MGVSADRIMKDPSIEAGDHMNPYLFLDVDGVLNAFDLDLSGEADMFDDFEVHEVELTLEDDFPRTFIVCLSLAMCARIAQLVVDIHWATTWEHRADSHIAPLCGLPRGRPALTPGDGAEEWNLDWKFTEVRRTVERDPRPFVWIDDHLDLFGDWQLTPRLWATDLAVPSLLIAPDPATGLQPTQLDAVEQFVRRYGGESDL